MKNAEKLLEFLPSVEQSEISGLPVAGTPESVYSWSANLYTEGRERILVFTNEYTKTPIVFLNFKAIHRNKFAEIFKEAVRDTFETYSINPEFIDDYLQNFGVVTRYKLSDRKSVAASNVVMRDLFFGDDYLECDDVYQPYFAERYKNWLVKDAELTADNDSEYTTYGNLLLYRLGKIDAKYKKNSATMFVFDIDLYIAGGEGDINRIYRQLSINSNKTFLQFHRAIQMSMYWLDYHLWNFVMLGKKVGTVVEDVSPKEKFSERDSVQYEIDYLYGEGNGFVPVVKVTIDHEDGYITEDDFVYLDTVPESTKLKEMFPNFGDAIYKYDYGDDWTFKVKFVESIENPDDDNTKCLSAIGDAPPEDVGGMGGYLGFLRTIENKDNLEEATRMKAWAKDQGYSPMDISTINRRLKYGV
jgi:hypothetical protein